MWFLNLARGTAQVIGALLLVVYTAAYCVHLAMGIRPDCQCLGRVVAYLYDRNEALWNVVRNGVLIGLLAAAWLLRRGERDLITQTEANAKR